MLSSGGMVLNRLLKIGGDDFDAAVAARVRHNHDFLIGKLTAERLRREFGVFDQGADASLTVSGRDLMKGVPKEKKISIGLVRASMKEPLAECAAAIRTMIERTPPDVRKGIEKNGICLTGGIANLRGLSTYLEESVGLPVSVAQKPELCAVQGLKKMIQNKEFKKLTYSMLDEDYRWLR